MNKLMLTAALVAMTALSACDNKADETASTEPAAGETTTMSAPADTTTSTTTVETTTTETVAPSEPVVMPEGTTTTNGVAVGEPNPAADNGPNCGDHMDLIGKNASEIDQTSFDKPVRVLGPDSAATMDYNPERINIHTDAVGKVIDVRCG